MAASASMPSGTYFTVVGNLKKDKGGLTSATLERTRLINDRLADGDKMPIVTLSAADTDDMNEYDLVDGVDVLNLGRHGGLERTAQNQAEWLRQLAEAAQPTAAKPVYFICDGHRVAPAAMARVRQHNVAHVHFILVAHNPTTSARFASFRQHAHLADAVVCATRRQAELIRSNELHGGPVRSEPVFDIAFPRRAAAVLNGERDDRRIVMLARIHSQKNLMLAVQSFSALRDLAERNSLPRADELRLDIYGKREDKAEYAELTAAIRDYGLEGLVILHGYRPEARGELAKSSVLWLTSKFEGWALAITEAQQSGCIPISVDVLFGPREQIRSGWRRDGFLVGSSSVEIANQTLRVMQMRPARIQRIRDAAVRRVNAADRSPAAYVDNWARVIQAIRK